MLWFIWVPNYENRRFQKTRPFFPYQKWLIPETLWWRLREEEQPELYQHPICIHLGNPKTNHFWWIEMVKPPHFSCIFHEKWSHPTETSASRTKLNGWLLHFYPVGTCPFHFKTAVPRGSISSSPSSPSWPETSTSSPSSWAADFFQEKSAEIPRPSGETFQKKGGAFDTPPKTNELIPKMMVWKRWFLLNMVIFGFYVKISGGYIFGVFCRDDRFISLSSF